MLPYTQAPPIQGQANGNPVWYPTNSHPPMPPGPPYLPVMNQFPGNYFGVEIKPLSIAGGQYSWDRPTEERMVESDAILAELVRRDLAKNTIDEMLNNEDINSTRRQLILKVLENRVIAEGNSGMTWNLASVKLTKKLFTARKGNNVVKKINVTSIRVILTRVQSQVPGSNPYPGMPPHIAGVQLPGPVYGDPHIPHDPNPIIHQGAMGPRHSADLPGRAMRAMDPRHPADFPGRMAVAPEDPDMFRMDSPSEVPEEYSEEETHHHRDHKKGGKKGKDKNKGEDIEIYIPDIRSHARHNSKNSSRPSSWADSDGASIFNSPMTSVSNSPNAGGLHDSKQTGKNYKGYRGQGSDGSHRYRGKDAYVEIPRTRHPRDRRSMNEDNRLDAGSSRHYPRDSTYHDDAALASTIERLQLHEYDKKVQDRQQLQRDVQLDNRLGNIEALLQQQRPREREVIVQGGSLYNRRSVDEYDIGYSSAPRRRWVDRGVRPDRYM